MLPFCVPHPWAQPRPSAYWVRGGQATRAGGRCGLGDVSMSYANRETSRSTGLRQPIKKRECSLAAAGGNKDPGAGTAGRVSGRRTPWAEAGGGLTWGRGRCGGRGGSEVVVRRSVPASVRITGRAASRGLDGEAAGLRLGSSQLLRSPAGL